MSSHGPSTDTDAYAYADTDTDTDTDTDIVDAERAPPHPFDFRPIGCKGVECEILSRS